MKPIRDYSDGEWLLLLWAFVVLFLAAGLAFSTTVLVVAVLGALAAGYTTFLYVADRTGHSTTITVFGRSFGPARGETHDAGHDDDPHQAFEDSHDEDPHYENSDYDDTDYNDTDYESAFRNPEYQNPEHQNPGFQRPPYQRPEYGETEHVEGGNR